MMKRSRSEAGATECTAANEGTAVHLLHLPS
jgi:hypothetical protein